MNLDHYTTLKEIRSFIGNTGLQLKFEKQCMPRTDGRTIYVQKPEATWSPDQITTWKATVYHEAGHNEIAMRDCFDLIRKEKIDMSSLVGHLLNIVDDYRQEKYRLGMYAGRDACLSRGGQLIIDQILAKKQKNPDGEMSDTAIADVIQCWSIKDRAAWQRDLLGRSEKWAATLSKEQTAYYNNVISKFKGRLDMLVTAEDELQLVLELLDAAGRDSAKELEQSKSSGEGDGEESGAGGSGDEQGGEGKDKTAEGKMSSDADRGDKDSQGMCRVKYEDIMLHDHEAAEEGQPSYSTLKIDYSGYDGDGGFNLSTDVRVMDFANDEGLISNRDYYTSGVEAMGDEGKGLANTVRKLLQVLTQKRNVYGKKKGHIANKNVYRAALKNTGGYQQKVFRQKEQRLDLDVAVTVLIDNSGSMGGEPIIHAMKSGLMLNDAIGKLGVPVEILGFTDRGRQSTINLYKDFDQRVSEEVLLSRLDSGCGNMSSNADGESILWAYHRLRPRKEKRKLLVVLSDGQPASSRGDADALTKRVVKQIEKDGEVEIYGIGIMSHAVERYYTNNTVINDSSELETALLTVIKNYIIK